jgi:hypothetical protein
VIYLNFMTVALKFGTVEREGSHAMNSLQDIERAIDGLKPQELAELYAWLDRHRPAGAGRFDATVFEQGLGLFGSPEDAALLDEVVELAYEERRRASSPSTAL